MPLQSLCNHLSEGTMVHTSRKKILKQGFKLLSITVTLQKQQKQQSHIKVAQKAAKEDLGRGRLASSCKSQWTEITLGFQPLTDIKDNHDSEILQTVDREQTRDFFVLSCNVISISKIDSQILTKTQLPGKAGRNLEPRIGAQASLEGSQSHI